MAITCAHDWLCDALLVFQQSFENNRMAPIICFFFLSIIVLADMSRIALYHMHAYFSMCHEFFPCPSREPHPYFWRGRRIKLIKCPVHYTSPGDVSMQ